MLKNRLPILAVVISLLFIYGLATYGGMSWAEIGGFLWATLQLLLAMFLLALMLAFVIRGIKKLLGVADLPQEEEPSDKE